MRKPRHDAVLIVDVVELREAVSSCKSYFSQRLLHLHTALLGAGVCDEW